MSDRPSRREPISRLPPRGCRRSSFAPLTILDERYDTTRGRSLAYAVPSPAAPPAPLLASFRKFCSAASLESMSAISAPASFPLAADFPAPAARFAPSAPASAPPFDAKSSSLFFTSRSTRPGLSPPRRSAPLSALAVLRSRPAGDGDLAPRAPAPRAPYPGRSLAGDAAARGVLAPLAIPLALFLNLSSSRCFFSRTYAVGSIFAPVTTPPPRRRRPSARRRARTPRVRRGSKPGGTARGRGSIAARARGRGGP